MEDKIKKCLQCGKDFYRRTKKHFFCCKSCYNKYYSKELENNKFPEVICQKCGKKTKLNFNPKKDFQKLKEFKCSHCDHQKSKDYS